MLGGCLTSHDLLKWLKWLNLLIMGPMLRLLNPDPGRRCLCVTIPLDDQTSIRFRFLGLLGVPLCPHPGTMAKAVQILSAAGFYSCSVLLAPCWASASAPRMALAARRQACKTGLAHTGAGGSRIPSAILQAQAHWLVFIKRTIAGEDFRQPSPRIC